MPPCPEGGCHCAWFWIHSPDSGSEQSRFFLSSFCETRSLILLGVDYMTGFRCNITGSTSNVPLAKPQLPRRCGADPPNNVPNPTPGNCTYGAKSPFYWDQAERNNVSFPAYFANHEPVLNVIARCMRVYILHHSTMTSTISAMVPKTISFKILTTPSLLLAPTKPPFPNRSLPPVALASSPPCLHPPLYLSPTPLLLTASPPHLS